MKAPWKVLRAGTVFKCSAADGRRAHGEDRNEKLDHTVYFISILYKDYGSVVENITYIYFPKW